MKLKDIGKIVTGKTPSTKQLENFSELADKYLFVTPRDMKDNCKYIESTERYLTSFVEDKFKSQIIKKDSVCISCIGSDMGKVYMINRPGITNQQINSITDIKDICNPHYLYYYFSDKKEYLKGIAGGSTMPILNKSTFENIEIDLPARNIQDKIVKILNNIDNKIGLNNKTNDNLYKILEQYIKEHYYNNEFVRNGNVNDIGKIQGGYAFKGKDLLNETTNNKILKIKNISASGVDIDNTQCVYDEVADKVDKKFLLLRGNVIIAMTGAELGKTGYLYGQDYRYFLNQRVGVIRGNDKYSELYLNCLFLLEDMQNTLNSKGYGSAQPNISTSDIENIEIPIPKEDELETFYEKCNPIYSKMILNSEQNQSLTQLRDALLPKLMSGEIDLDKIEI